LPNGYPWGLATAAGTSPFDEAPNTGVIREYHWEIARGYLAPDGVNKSSILINGQYPGPTIEANWGDTIQVRLKIEKAEFYTANSREGYCDEQDI
jgi:FtsP/CotA-like multicopper oxidase with cupredoxin domain